MIFKISRKTRIQDAKRPTLFRNGPLFSCKRIAIHITKIIPCLSRQPSPSVCPLETCSRLVCATGALTRMTWKKEDRALDTRPTHNLSNLPSFCCCRARVCVSLSLRTLQVVCSLSSDRPRPPLCLSLHTESVCVATTGSCAPGSRLIGWTLEQRVCLPHP